MLYAVMPSFEKVRTVDARSQAMIDDNLRAPNRSEPDVDVRRTSHRALYRLLTGTVPERGPSRPVTLSRAARA